MAGTLPLICAPHFLFLQEDTRADVVDCVVRDIQNSQCLLNVEYSGPTCPHVTIQFGDTKDDVGLGLVKEGLVMVDVRKEKHLQKMVGGPLLPDSRAAAGANAASIQLSLPCPRPALWWDTVRIDNPAVRVHLCPSIRAAG